jgi:hypothetical protein
VVYNPLCLHAIFLGLRDGPGACWCIYTHEVTLAICGYSIGLGSGKFDICHTAYEVT